HTCTEGICVLDLCLTPGACSDDECTLITCGDGTVDPGEQCDDNNNTNGDGCSSTCQIEISDTCGDGTIDTGEQCDDGNVNNGDGCNNSCQVEQIPTTALISDDVDRVLIAMSIIFLGFVLVKFDYINKFIRR